MGTTKFNNINQISYKQNRNEIKSGDILFCSGNYLVSDLIKKFSNSIFSHVGFVFPWNDRVLVMESVEDDGVRVVPLSHYLFNYNNSKQQYNGNLYIGRHESLDSPGFNQENINKMLRKSIDLLNRKYDNNEIGKIISRIALGIGRHEDNDEYICSEFVDVCFKELGIEFQRDSKGFIYPEHIATDPKVKPVFQIIP